MERKLYYAYLGNGLTFWEEGDKQYKGHISQDRKISIYKNVLPLTDENKKKIEEFARCDNMVYNKRDSKGFLVLDPINPPTKEYINDVTYEALQLSVETVNGKEYVCKERTIFSYFPENFNDIPHIDNKGDKKYCLTEYKRDIKGHTLYRIRALKNFGSVKAGELGGYVEFEHNLSQHGNCWLFGSSAAYQLANVKDNAKVADSVLFGCATAKDNTHVIFTTMSGNCTIQDNATSNNSLINGNVIICDKSRVSGTIDFNGFIKDSVFITSPAVVIKGNKIELSGNLNIRDKVHIEDNAKISGKVFLSGSAIICNNAEIHGDIDGEGVIIKDYAFVGGWSRVRDNAIICDSAKILDMCLVRDNAYLGNNAKLLHSAEVSGKAKITQNAILSGCAKAKDNAQIMGESHVTEFVEISGSSTVKDDNKKIDNELTL